MSVWKGVKSISKVQLGVMRGWSGTAWVWGVYAREPLVPQKVAGSGPKRGQLLQSGHLIPNPWLDSPLHGPPNPRPAAFPHPEWKD